MTANLKPRTIPHFVVSAAVAVCLLGCGTTTSPPESTVEWIDPNKIQQGPTLHDTLPAELLTRIKAVHETFADVDGTPLEKWIDDFKRDLDPEGNIRVWEDMQVAYNSYCNQRELPLETRREVFRIVLMRSMMPDKDVLARLELEHVPADDVPIILAAYPGDAKPIDVIQTDQIPPKAK
ncbi:hypothetical protein VN12_25015 [Pirellula sp. SH-Sr6A]|uniref:hypothetical protein n=1 Tax=Pirellula sp. SH-Sr6A TaxID=1632865 RepID=UPI00078B808B|nr:hypothetical protein [Pirellula sp. SH-Sr6A]AMV35375.1 hypothetical protein VN12_25015 [Pirellula sp. SH-Sr6A]